MFCLLLYCELSLRQRPDTVRCIVSFLTEKNNFGFDAELITEDVSLMESSDTEDDDTNWEDWEPDPVEVSQGIVRLRKPCG